MKDTKDQILRSLDGLNGGQMNLVLHYIRDLNQSIDPRKNYKSFKNNALRQIKKALGESKTFA